MDTCPNCGWSEGNVANPTVRVISDTVAEMSLTGRVYYVRQLKVRFALGKRQRVFLLAFRGEQTKLHLGYEGNPESCPVSNAGMRSLMSLYKEADHTKELPGVRITDYAISGTHIIPGKEFQIEYVGMGRLQWVRPEAGKEVRQESKTALENDPGF